MARPEEEMAFRDDRIRTLKKERDALAARLAEAERLLGETLNLANRNQTHEGLRDIGRRIATYFSPSVKLSQIVTDLASQVLGVPPEKIDASALDTATVVGYVTPDSAGVTLRSGETLTITSTHPTDRASEIDFTAGSASPVDEPDSAECKQCNRVIVGTIHCEHCGWVDPPKIRASFSAPGAPEPTMVVANYGTEIYRGPPSGWAQFKLEPGVLYNLTAKYVDSTAETADEGLIECRRCGCRQRAAIGSKGWREVPMCHQCAVETGETL